MGKQGSFNLEEKGSENARVAPENELKICLIRSWHEWDETGWL